MGVIERVHDPVLDQRSDAVVAEFAAEGFHVVASVGGEAAGRSSHRVFLR